MQLAKEKASGEIEQRRRSYSPCDKEIDSSRGFSASYNEGASAKRPKTKSMDKGKGKGKGKDKGKPIIAPATSTTTSEDMDVQEEAPARGSKRSASPPTVGNTTAPSSVCGPGSATKKA